MKNTLILFLFLTFNLFGYINIYPVIFDKKIDGRGDYQEYTLYNPTQNILKYQLYLSDQEIKDSMKDWAEIFPTTITLKPGTSGKFKIFIKAPKGHPQKEYLLTLEVKELALPKLNSKETNTVQILTHLKIDLTGYIGELYPKILLKDFSLTLKNKNLSFNGSIQNIGDRRGTLNFYLAQKNEKNLFYIGNLRLLKEEKINASKLNQKLTEYDEELVKNFSKYNTLIIKDSSSKKTLYKNTIK